MLCSNTNRFPLPGSPSTCALDTTITPIPSFILLGFVVIYVPTRFFFFTRTRRSTSHTGVKSASKDEFDHDDDRYSYPYSYSSPSESAGRTLTGTSTGSYNAVLNKWIHRVYVGLVVCLLGLRVLEIARLIVADMGVGLLPVGIVANVLNIGMLTFCGLGMGMGRARGLLISASLLIYWSISVILESVKVTRLASYNSLFPAKGTGYPSSDWLLDNACMLGLLVAFFLLEGTHLVLRWRSSYLPPAALSGIGIGTSTAVRNQERRVLSISKPRIIEGYDPVDPLVYLKERSRTDLESERRIGNGGNTRSAV